MSDQPLIQLHNAKETEFEFNVAINGLSESTQPIVRFVLENVKGYNVTINCQQLEEGNWSVKVPALKNLNETHNFYVEVLADGYYFIPTTGLVEVVHAPQVTIKENFTIQKVQPKPVVSAKVDNVEVQYEPQLRQFYDLTEAEQDVLQAKTKQAGILLQKAGKIMESGFDPASHKPLDTATLDKMIGMITESVASIKSKIFG